MATADLYGTDIDCLNGHGLSWGLASGARNVANAIGRRLITQRGGLFYDPDYGFDTREYLGVALTRGKLAELIQGVESEALKDIRVQAVVASVSATGNPSTSLTLELSVTLADGPVFDMILTIQALVPGAPTVTFSIGGEDVPRSGLIIIPDASAVTPPAAFTPLTLGSTLKLWLRGDLGITQSVGNVTAWADQSGNGNNVTGSIPYNASSIGGQPGLTFSAAGMTNGASNIITGSSARTIFAVLKQTSAAFNSVLTIRTGFSAGFVKADYGLPFAGNAGLIYTDGVNNPNNAAVSSPPTVTGVPAIVEWQSAGPGTTLIYKQNGVAYTVTQASGSSTDGGTTGFTIGGSGAALAAFVGEYDELIVCDTALSAGNELLVKTYLSTRYGIAVS